MNYLVMETHPAYAVVLDEAGRFLKVANLRYQVGDRVDRVIELRTPEKKRRALWKPLSGAAGLAACLCMVFFGYYQPNFTPYGALRIRINPDVELTLSRTERVLDLEGLNPDGLDLIEGYDYAGKTRTQATGDLVERAIDMGYLSDGETVSITVTSGDHDWQTREEETTRSQLEARYGETIVIQVGPPAREEPPQEEPAPEEPPRTEVMVPVTPPPAPVQDTAPVPAPAPSQAAPPVRPTGDDDDREDDGDDGDDDRSEQDDRDDGDDDRSQQDDRDDEDDDRPQQDGRDDRDDDRPGQDVRDDGDDDGSQQDDRDDGDDGPEQDDRDDGDDDTAQDDSDDGDDD